jgi:hypothetical protein
VAGVASAEAIDPGVPLEGVADKIGVSGTTNGETTVGEIDFVKTA